MDFLQSKNIKALNGGKGLMEILLGVDYKSLKINPDYELVPSKAEYTETVGACAGLGTAAARRVPATSPKACRTYCDLAKSACHGYNFDLAPGATQGCSLLFAPT